MHNDPKNDAADGAPTDNQRPFRSNKCRCRACGDVIESKHRHDMVWCKCKSIFTDGGTSYIRRGGKDLALIEDLSDQEES